MTTRAERLLWWYLDAGVSGRRDDLVACYAPEFEATRVGLDGSITHIDRATMVGHLASLWESGETLPPADDVIVLGTSTWRRLGAVVFERTKGSRVFLYTFVFDLDASGVSLVSELAVETAARPKAFHYPRPR